MTLAKPIPTTSSNAGRRQMLLGSAAIAGATLAASASVAAAAPKSTARDGNSIVVKDGTEIFYKDWGSGQPIVFHHGWPLTSDDWENQMFYFLAQGYRVIAHDRRGHGRSSPSPAHNDMDTYAADMAELAAHLNLKNAIHIGHSTGGGEVTRYVAKHGGNGRVAKAVLIGAIPPVMLQSASNPGGLPMSVFDGIRAGLAAGRAQLYKEFPQPFYSYNRPGAKPSQGVLDNWWRQGMMGDIKAHYDCVKAFSETDFTEDLKRITVPVLVMHGEDDQIVPIANSALLAVKLLKQGQLKTYPGFPHGMCTTHPDVINPDLLAFVRA